MRKRLASLAALAAVAVLVPVAATDAATNDGSPNDPRAKAFVKEVSVDRVERHQQRLQEIATANGGTRDVFHTGYTKSLDYVVRVLENAGYNPQVTPFNFPFWEETQLPVLNQVTPAPPKTYRPGTAEQRRHDRRRLHHVRRLAHGDARRRAGRAGRRHRDPEPGRHRRAAAPRRTTPPRSRAPWR